MQRLKYVICIIVTIVAVAFASCSHKNATKNPVTITESLEGWINDDTYQIAAGGVPISSLTLITQRKESARLAALLNARCQIIKIFTGYTVKQDDLNNDNQLEGIPITEELKTVVNSGIIKKTVWDDDANCEIVYEVKYPGLKQRVDEGAWK